MMDNRGEMPGRITLKTVNDELTRLGHHARLERATTYFYFFGGEAADWLERIVQVSKISDLTLEQWISEFVRLKKLNGQILRAGLEKTEPPKPKTR